MRIKDIDNPKKRNKTTLLDKENFLIMKEVKKLNPKFNFSAFVNGQIKKVFKNSTKEIILQEQIELLEQQQEEHWYKLSLQILFLKQQQKEIRSKEESIKIQVSA